MKKICFVGIAVAVAVLSTGKTFADDTAASTASPTNMPSTRYGLFNGLDHRSSYGQGVYPEPFVVDDSDLESHEFRVDYLHTASGSDHGDIVHPELEWGFGNLTLELEAPYERDVAGGQTASGMDNVDIGARFPFFQYVSKNNLFDTAFGAGIEIGIPTTSTVSHDAEYVPKIFNDTKIGNFTVQSILGLSMLAGPDADGGLNTFEYGFVFGYDIPHKTLPIPGVEKIIPVAELSGETELNHERATNLTGDVGLRVNTKTIWGIQPRPGVIFVFPLNNTARADQHWGVMASFVFEF
ncbi:MAG TPA: hypothetical protein VK742_20160 [Candidatus Sulfotelmatobacter sp.]|nr:hypothetical protein [Candidatus Sulfotelmatobacter sp.]